MPRQRLNDKGLVKAAREYEKLRIKEKEIKQSKDHWRDQVKDELKARKTKAIEHGGVRVTIVEPTEIVYYPELLDKAHEEGRIKKKWYKKMFYRAIDKGAIQQMVQDGNIDPDVLNECSDLKVKMSYISVSFTGGD